MAADEKLSADRFRLEWGGGEWTTLNAREARKWRLPFEVEEFLVRAGLPRSAVLLVTFDLDRGLVPVVAASATELYLRIGSDDGLEICLCPERAWGVFGVGKGNELVAINSSIARFVFGLLEYRKYSERVQAVEDESEQLLIVRNFATAIAALDKNATLPGTWWSQVTAQAEQGFL